MRNLVLLQQLLALLLVLKVEVFVEAESKYRS